MTSETTAKPLSVADQIAQRTADDQIRHGRTLDEALKQRAEQLAKGNILASIRKHTHYKSARVICDIVLGIAILGILLSVISGIASESLYVASSTAIPCLALIILTSVSKAIFDIADKVTTK